MDRKFIIAGAVLGGLAVAIGAYGAHGGAKYMTPETAITFGKAVKYQMHHALAILITALLTAHMPRQSKILNLAGYAFLGGVVFFSGSLYLIVFAGAHPGYITPFGGTLFVAGWLLLVYAALKNKKQE
ncbi:MAG: DUF423 domain-containing protein [Chlorobi bacterium]|nr:DUF423 domain-containing protein [Chlorobiota bacterium]